VQHNDENENRGKESAGRRAMMGETRLSIKISTRSRAAATRRFNPESIALARDFNANRRSAGGITRARATRAAKAAIPLQLFAAQRAGINVAHRRFRLTRARADPSSR